MEKNMGNKTVAEYASEIQKIEGQISDLNKAKDDNQNSLKVENLTFEQLQKEEQNLLNDIKSIGFFNFKEKKPIKLKLKGIKEKLKKNDTALNELKEKIENLSKKINDLQNQLIPIQRAKEEQEREEKWKNDLRTGKISGVDELEKISYELQKCFVNINEFMDKYKLFSEWQNNAEAFGSSSPQANSIWNDSRSRYYCSPLDAIRNHKTVEYPYALREKLDMIREVINDTRISLLISDFDKIKDALDKIRQVQWSANR